MAEIIMREVTNSDYVQEAEMRIPVDNPEEVRKAFAIVHELRRRAAEHVGVTDDNADYTAIECKTVEGDVAVVTFIQVNV